MPQITTCRSPSIKPEELIVDLGEGGGEVKGHAPLPVQNGDAEAEQVRGIGEESVTLVGEA